MASNWQAVLVADTATQIRDQYGRGRHDCPGYARLLATLRQNPACIGLYLCGAYLRNETRKRALRAAAEMGSSG